MFPDDDTIPQPPPSLSSAAITSSNPDPNPLVDPKIFQDDNNQSFSNFRPLSDSHAAVHTQNIPGIYQPTVAHDVAGQLPSFQDWSRHQGNSDNQVEDSSGHDNAGQPPSVGTVGHGHRNSRTGRSGGDNGGDLPPSRMDVGPREGTKTGTSAGDQNVGQEEAEYCNISLTGQSIYKHKPPPYYLDEKYGGV